MAIPTATTVRKMGSTAVARKCSVQTQEIVARQMNHDIATSRKHYQATISDRDAAGMYQTIRDLRVGTESISELEDSATTQGVGLHYA